MLLTLDVGNTEITLGLFRERELEAHWRLTTNPDRTPDEWAASIAAFLDHAGRSPNEVRAACLASVAPAVTQSIAEGVETTTGCRPLAVDAR
jgi:type III pantothenate kinase